MIRVHSDLIQFRGNHGDFGFQQGQLLRDSPIIPNREKHVFSKSKYRFMIDVEHYKRALLPIAPNIWDEIVGLAEGLEMNLEDAVRHFGGYYLEYGRSGCTIFTGNNFMIRNYDNDPQSYEGRYIVYAPTDGGYATIGPSMQITGRTDGMNEKGLVMGYNFTNRKQSADGLLCNMIGRLVLELCANVDEAVAFLKELPHRHSFTYALIDPERSIIVEASPREVVTRQDNFCMNHFEVLTEENRKRMDDSLRRKNIILREQSNIQSSIQAYHLMNDMDKGVFSTSYGAWSGTLHTSSFYPHERKVGFTLGGNRLPYLFDLTEWLTGKDFQVRRVNGELDTKTPFIN